MGDHEAVRLVHQEAKKAERRSEHQARGPSSYVYDQATTVVYQSQTMKIPSIIYKILPSTRASCGNVKGKRVLDLGCGTGDFYRHLGDVAAIHAVDMSESQLAAAKQLDQTQLGFDAGRVSYQVADIFKPQKFEGRPFDIVLLSFVLSHAVNAEQLQAALSNALQHLEPANGIVIINHSVGMIPGELVQDAQKYIGSRYAALPATAVSPGEPYNVVFGAKGPLEQQRQITDHFYPVDFLEQQLRLAGFQDVRHQHWIDEYPDDFPREFPSERLQEWFDSGNQIAHHITATVNGIAERPTIETKKDYPSLWLRVLRNIGHTTQLSTLGSRLYTLSRKEDSGAVFEFVCGYCFGCNTSLSEQLCKDKKLTHSVLSACGVPVVEHLLVPGVKQSAYLMTQPRWPPVRAFFEQHGHDVVIKPTRGKAGDGVHRARSLKELDHVFCQLQHTSASMVVTPYVHSSAEIRVLVAPRLRADAAVPRRVRDFEVCPVIVFRKEPLTVIGDGNSTLAELLLRAAHPACNHAELIRIAGDAAATILPLGASWRSWMYNHSLGARFTRVRADEEKEACDIALRAARALGLWYGAVDIMQPDNVVLEVNTSIVTDVLDVPLIEAVRIARMAFALLAALRRESFASATQIGSNISFSRIPVILQTEDAQVMPVLKPNVQPPPTVISTSDAPPSTWQTKAAARNRFMTQAWIDRECKVSEHDHGYLVMAQKEANHFFNIGFDFGHVLSSVGTITSGKALCYYVLQRAKVPCVVHEVVYIAPIGESADVVYRVGIDAALAELKLPGRLPCVLKIDGRSGGDGVEIVDSLAKAEVLFLNTSPGQAVCWSPLESIQEEYRCIVVGGIVMLSLIKQRQCIQGDGCSTVVELMARIASKSQQGRALFARWLSEWSQVVVGGITVWNVPDNGTEIPVTWKHNMDYGSIPRLCETPPEVAAVAAAAACALQLTFAAVDVVVVNRRVSGSVGSNVNIANDEKKKEKTSLEVLVLEVNACPMFNHTIRVLPSVAAASVKAVIDVVMQYPLHPLRNGE